MGLLDQDHFQGRDAATSTGKRIALVIAVLIALASALYAALAWRADANAKEAADQAIMMAGDACKSNNSSAYASKVIEAKAAIRRLPESAQEAYKAKLRDELMMFDCKGF